MLHFTAMVNKYFLNIKTAMLHNQTLFDRKLTVRMDRVDNKPDGPPKLPDGLRGLGMGLGAGGAPLQDVSSEFCYEYIFYYVLIVEGLKFAGPIIVEKNFRNIGNTEGKTNINIKGKPDRGNVKKKGSMQHIPDSCL